MKEKTRRAAIDTAKKLIKSSASRGLVKDALMAGFGLERRDAGRLTRTAVVELYGSATNDPDHWLRQMGGDATPLQRRYARRRFQASLSHPASRAWRLMILASDKNEIYCDADDEFLDLDEGEPQFQEGDQQ